MSLVCGPQSEYYKIFIFENEWQLESIFAIVSVVILKNLLLILFFISFIPGIRQIDRTTKLLGS